MIDFLATCQRLSLPRESSFQPILSTSSARIVRCSTKHDSVGIDCKKINAKRPLGMDPKKSHEVDRFTAYVQHAFSTSGIQHVLDIGSGRAHLSRQLALPPNNLQVTCIDNSAHQTSRAERLNGRYQLDPESEQLRHLVMQLDEQNIVAFLQEWPEKAGNGLVVALHACGDLTVDVLRALVKAAAGNARIKGAVIVGCCYNLMTSRSQ